MNTHPLYPVLAATILLAGALTTFGRAPIATNDTYAVSKDATLAISAPGVLANDFDSNGHALSVSALTSTPFVFDGITFDQAFTPNLYKSLTPAAYSNAVVTLAPSAVAGSIANGFPAITTGFLGSLSIGLQFQDSPSASTTKALNLPSGDNGTLQRSGFELGWASGVMLTNLTGDDFVVFEAGTTGAPEAFMVQVHIASDDIWSPWVYVTPQSYANYNGRSDGLHSTKFNLDAFGIPANGRVDAIRIANITDEDRMADLSGEGVVLPEDAGTTSTTLPKAPGGGTYAGGSLDPDIVYVGGLHTLGATIPAYAATSELGATVSVNSDGSFSYDPSTSGTLQALGAGQSAVDSFYYLVTDGFSGHTRGLVSVTVSAPTSTQPRLVIVRSGSNVIVKWPNTASDFTLESTPSFSPAGWQAVGLTPVADGSDLTVTVDASSGTVFFRLKKSSET
ncbi:MAG: VCBS domain-containing protein [Verrucomicrobiota bacterium]